MAEVGMTIQEFIKKTKEEHRQAIRNRAASEVLLGPPKEINWPLTLESAGYYSHHLHTIKHWTDIHVWCREHFGETHYAWTGSVFWFERREDAVFFKLKWS